MSRFRLWLAPLATVLGVGAAAFDATLSASGARNQHTSLNRLANTLQPLGLDSYDVPVLAGTWVVARIVGLRPGNAVLRIAAGYLAADLLQGALKFAVGRHRPDPTAGDPWRFRPFSAQYAWQSFPSGHTTHVFSIAAGIAAEVQHPAVRIVAYGC